MHLKLLKTEQFIGAKGKPVENQGRKAIGSKVHLVL